MTAGIFFLIAGAAFLLEALDVWELRGPAVIPLFLVALGVSLLIGRGSPPPAGQD